ncbi:MAG: helix-turn-helix domain-containing protein [Rhodocyclaceae bacterium]|jgi:transcriptional regulator GlxA family with amidase domain|nr:helix-turn-helix domain-containing protein [Rhodocyclaceae bacterium]
MALNPSRIAGGQAIDRNLRAGQAKTLPQKHLAQDAAGKGRVAEAVLSRVGQWAQAGLLEGRAATTHWRLPGYLRQRHPGCRVDINPMERVQERVISAGAALARRVRRATGKSALDLVQAVRLRRARHLLETTDLPLGEVAARVGYGDATALRKLTLRPLKVTPGRLRGCRTSPFGANS